MSHKTEYGKDLKYQMSTQHEAAIQALRFIKWGVGSWKYDSLWVKKKKILQMLSGQKTHLRDFHFI